MITITWDWVSFIAGVIATVTFEFWALVWIAVRSWRKQQREASSFNDMIKSWSGKNSK